MNQTDNQHRQLTEEERARLRELRDRLWSNFDDEDKVCLREGATLTSDEWSWLKELLATTILRAEVAQGLSTPNPFVLCLEVPKTRGWEELLMLHPTQLPEALSADEVLKSFRALESQSSQSPST